MIYNLKENFELNWKYVYSMYKNNWHDLLFIFMYNPLSLLTKSIALRKNDLTTTGKIILTMKNMYNFYLGILLQVLICDMFDFLNEYLLENICKENIANLINNMQKKS